MSPTLKLGPLRPPPVTSPSERRALPPRRPLPPLRCVTPSSRLSLVMQGASAPITATITMALSNGDVVSTSTVTATSTAPLVVDFSAPINFQTVKVSDRHRHAQGQHRSKQVSLPRYGGSFGSLCAILGHRPTTCGYCHPPQPGPQEAFLSSSADIAIYGSAASGGKT